MQAVKQDDWWISVPRCQVACTAVLAGHEPGRAAGIPTIVYKRVRARDLLIRSWSSSPQWEPGVLFLDAANREKPGRIYTNWKPQTMR